MSASECNLLGRVEASRCRATNPAFPSPTLSLTDRSICHLAQFCNRLRYIDLACCPQLTDLSVLELASNLPKLRRIGLVRVSTVARKEGMKMAGSGILRKTALTGTFLWGQVTNLTDNAIYGLVSRYTSLERIHLSYCENVSVPAVFWLLERLIRLTHLSLTGVPAFRKSELQAMCREPPRVSGETPNSSC
jgi:F-box and leucine-rich repeat protein GRR1